MAPKAAVSKESATTVVEKYIHYFETNKFPARGSEVWVQMSEALNKKWTPLSVYTNVREDRRSILSTARLNKNIVVNETQNISINDSFPDSEPLNSSHEFECPEEADGLDTFEVYITNEEWHKMIEPPTKYGDRTYRIMHRNVWTDLLHVIIWKQLKLPCVYIFRHSKIYTTPGSLHFLRITGRCKSKKCGNRFFGYVDVDPVDDDFYITVRTKNTQYIDHEEVRRPLRGERRKKVGEEVFHEGCGNWQKQEALEHMKTGDRLPPHISKLSVLRQAKREYIDKKLEVKPSDGREIMRTIGEMARTAPYRGSIHDYKGDKFYVFYSTPAQLLAYKQYRQITKRNCTIAIDGTGSLVQPLLHCDGTKSGHIFLYAIVINFEETTLPVYHMLTESQHTDLFVWGLKNWLHLGAPKPTRVVCDFSRALLNGISLAFNGQTIKTYIETCFLYAIKNSEYYYRPQIQTYIGLDVAHFINMIRRWPCMQNMRHTKVREFYLLCVSLMIDCQELEQFTTIFLLTCTVALHPYRDTVIDAATRMTVEDVRHQLLKYMTDRNLNSGEENGSNITEENLADISSDEVYEHSSRLKMYIQHLLKMAEVTISEGSEINGYYFKDFIERFISVAYEFPLWSGVGMPFVTGHSSSSIVEEYFNNKKHRVLKNYGGRLRVDKFLKVDLKDILGCATIFSSKLSSFIEKRCPYPSPLEKDQPILPNIETFTTFSKPGKPLNIITALNDSDTYSHDNWRNKGINEQSNKYKSEEMCNESFSVVNDDIPKTMQQYHIYINHNVTQDFDSQGREECNIVCENIEWSKGKVDINCASKPSQPMAKKSKYFKSYPDIQISHADATTRKKAMLLPNGNCLKSPVINSCGYFVTNTCNFDTIVQILTTSVLDVPTYACAVKSSESDTLRFVMEFIDKSVCNTILTLRVKVLMKVFPPHVGIQTNRRVVSYSINMDNNIAVVWAKCLQKEPSGYYEYTCTYCGTTIVTVDLLCVNHRIISYKGFGALEEAIQLNLHKIQCRNDNCNETCTTSFMPNFHVFIELDIRPDVTYKSGLNCQLKDIPPLINLSKFPLRLTGVIAYSAGHYIGYARRLNDRWEIYNDLKKKVDVCNDTATIVPHAVIYVME